MALAAVAYAQGDGPPPGDGGHLARSARARSTWSPPPAWRTPTGCRCCCCPATRSPAGRPDPVLQQVEHYGDPTTTVNDAFRPVSRYFDRITRPEQLLATLPQVARVLTDPADAGPVVLALPQDVQAEEYDFPRGDVRPSACTGCRGRAPTSPRSPTPSASLRTARAAAARRRRRRALLRRRRPGAGVRGGPRRPGRRDRRRPHPRAARPPAVRRPARHHRLGLRQRPGPPRPTSCSPSAPGCRTSRRRRGPRSPPASDVVTLNAARFDAVKHAAHAAGRRRAGDARRARRGARRLAGGPALDRARRRASVPRWDAHVDRLRAGDRPRRLADLRPGRGRGQRRERAGRLRAHRLRRDARRAARRLARPWQSSARHDGPRVRVLVHGLRGGRAVGRRDGPGADPPGRARHRVCSATART